MKLRQYNAGDRGRRQQGIALVITLVMLAVVTVMAVIFLGLSRRERAGVKLMEDLQAAQFVADAAVERAKAQAVGQMAMAGSTLSYDLFVSTNYISPAGFERSASVRSNPTNVSYVYAGTTNLVQGDDLLRVLANLQYDPRPPVFIQGTNSSIPPDFRFYLDFNRNRQFETNGWVAEMDTNNRPVLVDAFGGRVTSPTGTTFTNYDRFVGDPEWVGLLERPDYPHSESNRFVGRYAYIAMPAGKTLDLNHIHNHASTNSGVTDSLETPPPGGVSGFVRNEGTGSWEINLAAFLRELNTNRYAWPAVMYQWNPAADPVPRGATFQDARALLSLRYNRDRRTLLSARDLFPGSQDEIERNGIDEYGNGPVRFQPGGVPGQSIRDDDDSTRPWPGSPNTNFFHDVQQLLSAESYSPYMAQFVGRLRAPMNQATNATDQTRRGISSYDRYTYYRLLSQLGVDSTPNLRGKVHLNYTNAVGQVSTNLVPWTRPTPPTTNATAFFLAAADAMLKASIERKVMPVYPGNTFNPSFAGQPALYLVTNSVIGDTIVRPDISITNILVYYQTNGVHYPGNSEYTASIHRILQVAANIWDNMTNRWSADDPAGIHDPTVFRPVLAKITNGFIIRGFLEVTNANLLSDNRVQWAELTTNFYNSARGNFRYENYLFYGLPFVFGAKKGHPNFNEFSVETVAGITRKLELRKANKDSLVAVDTNVAHLVSLDNYFGIEAWNSYMNDYRREVAINADIISTIVLSNRIGSSNYFVARAVVRTATNNFLVRDWKGVDPDISAFKRGNYQIPVQLRYSLLTNALWVPNANGTGVFTNGLPNQFLDLHDAPNLILHTTNRVRYWVRDTRTGRLLDFVNLDKLVTSVDLGTLLLSQDAGSVANMQFTDGVPNIDGNLWNSNRLAAVSPLTVGITNQLGVSLGDPTTYRNIWSPYAVSMNDKIRSIALFRKFLGVPVEADLYDQERLGPLKASGIAMQSPFTPTRRYYVRHSWEANDPLVHYTASDLRPRNPEPSKLQVNDPLPRDPVTQLTGNLGRVNRSYEPWGGGLKGTNVTTVYNPEVKDPGVEGSDSWQFPITLATNNFYRYPNLGALGRVHRGTPWQTIYLKSFQSTNVNWTNWAGSGGTHPIADRRILNAFTTAPSEDAARGLLSVNQTNNAAWAAVLAGLPVTYIENNEPITRDSPPRYNFDFIRPATREFDAIMNGLNQYRALRTMKTNWVVAGGVYVAQVITNGIFDSIGGILGNSAFSLQSPYLVRPGLTPATLTTHRDFAWTDDIVERIPQQILSLVQMDEPRFVVYAFGQTLRPAPQSLATDASFYNLCTNYQITAEVVTKTAFRVDGELNNPANPLRAVVEEYRILPPAD